MDGKKPQVATKQPIDASIRQGQLYSPPSAMTAVAVAASDDQTKQPDVATKQPIDESIGQGQLYSPPSAMAAVAVAASNNQTKQPEIAVVVSATKEVAGDVRSALVLMKDTVTEKLAALPLPAEAIETGRKSMENLIKEVTHAYDNAKEAVQRTKDRIAESIMPTNPAKDASQVAEELDRSVLESAEGHIPETHHSKAYHDLKVSTGNAAQAKIKSRL